MQMSHILDIDDIKLSFGQRVILSDVHMQLQTGKITGLLGRNGQGKSCLFNIVFNRTPGQTHFLPQFDIMPTFLTVSRVFDDFNVDYPAFEKRFPEFNSRHNFRLKNLSGGQFRFLQTYIILKAKARFVILDEPFTHLMPLQIEKIIELIKEEKHNKGLLITDHLYRHVIDLSDDLYLLTGGKTYPVENPTDLQHLGYTMA